MTTALNDALKALKAELSETTARAAKIEKAIDEITKINGDAPAKPARKPRRVTGGSQAKVADAPPADKPKVTREKRKPKIDPKDAQEKVLAILTGTDEDFLTAAEIADKDDALSYHVVLSATKALIDEGDVTTDGKKRGTGYAIANDVETEANEPEVDESEADEDVDDDEDVEDDDTEDDDEDEDESDEDDDLDTIDLDIDFDDDED